MQGVVDAVARDVEILLDEGVDAVMFCNENDRPYRLERDAGATPRRWPASWRELAPRDRPFGVDYLWDARVRARQSPSPRGAAFIREVMPGVYESDMGLWRPDPAALLRERRALRGGRHRGADERDARVRVAARTPAARRAGALGGRLHAGRRDPRLGPDGRERSPTSRPCARCVDAVAGSAAGRCSTRGPRPPTSPRSRRSSTASSSAATSSATAATWNPVDRDRVRRFLAAARSA